MSCKKVCKDRITGATSCEIVSICKLLEDINKRLTTLTDVVLTQQAVITDILMRQQQPVVVLQNAVQPVLDVPRVITLS